MVLCAHVSGATCYLLTHMQMVLGVRSHTSYHHMAAQKANINLLSLNKRAVLFLVNTYIFLGCQYLSTRGYILKVGQHIHHLTFSHDRQCHFVKMCLVVIFLRSKRKNTFDHEHTPNVVSLCAYQTWCATVKIFTYVVVDFS